MPTSNAQNISRVLETAIALRPKSVLDIGVGMGKTGVLLREYLDLYLGDGSTWPPPRNTRIDGIEAHAEYLGPVQEAVYDEIMVGDALEILPRLPEARYELVLLIDVLEHFTVADAFALVAQARRVGTHVLAVSPAGERAQEASYGNEYERHRLTLTRRRAHTLGFAAVQRRNGSYFASVPSLRFASARWRLEYRARNLARRLPPVVYERARSLAGRSH